MGLKALMYKVLSPFFILRNFQVQTAFMSVLKLDED